MSKTRFSFGFGAVVGLILLVLTFLFLSPDQSYSQEEFRFQFEGQEIVGNLILPRSAREESRDCVVFVHGDGEMDRDGLSFYQPFFSHFAQRDMCALSWDKPGVGASGGNWLHYDMQARADLVVAAINALRAQAGFEVRSVGLIGFSQAGWVLPKVDAKANDIAFYIFVSPAVNWLDQSKFMSELRERDMSAEAIESRRKTNAAIDELLQANAPYSEFVALAKSHPEIDVGSFSKDRWDFVRINMSADLTEDLANLAGTPTLLLAGGRDGQLDARNSRSVFQKSLSDEQLKVGWFEKAGHSLIDVQEQKLMDDWDGISLVAKVAIGGKSAFTDGLWTTIDDFLAAQNIGSN